MAIEITVVEGMLEEQGLDKATANNYTNFDTEDSLKNVLESMKQPSFETLEDLDKNPKLKALASQFSDKQLSALQSKFDLTTKQLEELKKGGKIEKTEEVPAYIQAILDDQKSLRGKLEASEQKEIANKTAKEFSEKIKTSSKKFELEDDYQINLISATLSKDATIEDIDKVIKAHVEYLNMQGIKSGGKVGRGGKISSTKSTDDMMKEWKEKKEKEKEFFNKK